ncbi:hypothetical protein HMI54_010028 [Coelomomyces lativittatus]|nr:hypothetical protein HMI55_005328 [Coelomomyces lativittatus]KAJ1515136.1 hypothetical protein HMI56_006513 [Coelomomyces lativittatus]KAJ1516290.1 hypothetical protein HMI54_010028 [Coelomomyces lativittatus]
MFLCLEMSYPLISGYFKCPIDSSNQISKVSSPPSIRPNLLSPSSVFPNSLISAPFLYTVAEQAPIEIKNTHQELTSPKSESYPSIPIGYSSSKIPPPPGLSQNGKPSQSPVVPLNFENQKDLPSFKDFIYEVVQRTHAPLNVITLALFYIRRLHYFNNHCTGNQTSPHRLMLAALMVACKHLYDETYSNRTWVNVSRGKLTLEEVNKMEWEFLQYINFRMCVSMEEWNEFIQELDMHLVQFWLKYHQPTQFHKSNFVPNLLQEPSLKFVVSNPDPNPSPFPKCALSPLVLPTPLIPKSSPTLHLPQPTPISFFSSTFHPFAASSFVQSLYPFGQQHLFQNPHAKSFWHQPTLNSQTGCPWVNPLSIPTPFSHPPNSCIMHPQPYSMAPHLFHYISPFQDRIDSATDFSSKPELLLNQKVIVQP